LIGTLNPKICYTAKWPYLTCLSFFTLGSFLLSSTFLRQMLGPLMSPLWLLISHLFFTYPPAQPHVSYAASPPIVQTQTASIQAVTVAEPTPTPPPAPIATPTIKPVSRPVVAPPVQPITTGSHTDWMRAARIAPSDFQYVEYIVQKESGWNPSAVNKSSGACGLAQQLPCGKWAHTWNDPVGALIDASGYAVGRYGSWKAAYLFWLTHKFW
jgi:hypothetical protein